MIKYIVVDPGTWEALSSAQLFPCCGVKKLPPQNIKIHGEYEIPNKAIEAALPARLEVIAVIQTEPMWHYRLMLQGKTKNEDQ